MVIKKVFIILSLVLVLVLAACAGSTITTTTQTTTPAPTPTPTPTFTTTQTTTPAPTPTPVSINLISKNIAFNMGTITVLAGSTVTINFDNQDSGIGHNFSLYKDSSAPLPAIFRGQIITGPKEIIYTFTAPTTPGTYFFRCDPHPTTMNGNFIVQ